MLPAGLFMLRTKIFESLRLLTKIHFQINLLGQTGLRIPILIKSYTH